MYDIKTVDVDREYNMMTPNVNTIKDDNLNVVVVEDLDRSCDCFDGGFEDDDSFDAIMACVE